MRAGAIDIGTNTVRLLVADLRPDGTLVDVERQLAFARLGEGVDRTRTLTDAAMDRAIAAIGPFAERWRVLGCERTRAVATSAVRDASNRAAFLARVERETGVRVEVISGAEEARLSFAGATLGLDPGPAVVLDIGGGSTEIIAADDGGISAAGSLDIGAVRLTERHIAHDPPAAAEVEMLRIDAREALAGAPAARVDARLIGVAGTVTTLAVLALGLPAYDGAHVHHAVLTREIVEDLLVTLSQMTSSERRGLPAMPGREDVIVAGTAILAEVMDHFRVALCVVSVSDILDGTAMSAGAQESADGPTNA